MFLKYTAHHLIQHRWLRLFRILTRTLSFLTVFLCRLYNFNRVFLADFSVSLLHFLFSFSLLFGVRLSRAWTHIFSWWGSFSDISHHMLSLSFSLYRYLPFTRLHCKRETYNNKPLRVYYSTIFFTVWHTFLAASLLVFSRLFVETCHASSSDPSPSPSATEYADSIHGQKPQAVHIMGELTFTCAMVVLLRALNISCIVSTTHRNVIDDADGKKIVTFSFVQFREY
jgi:hypothetical protein